MKKLLTVLLLTVLMVFCLLSCRQASTVVESPNQPWAGNLLTDYASRFDYFWRGMNSHYVFWDVDPTDWDSVRTKYMPMFEELDKAVSSASAEKKTEAQDTAFETAKKYYTELSKTLIDHHLALKVYDPYQSRNSDFISPSSSEVKTRDYYHASAAYDKNDLVCWTDSTDIFSYFAEGGIGSEAADGYKTAANLAAPDEIAVNYLAKFDPETGKGQASADNVVYEFCIAYDITIDKKSSAGSDMHVVYLAMSGYNINNWLGKYVALGAVCPADPEAAFEWKAGKTLETCYLTISKYYNEGSLAGVILDNRVNGGGSAVDALYVIGLFTDKPVITQYSKYKEGFGKTDYSSEVPLAIEPFMTSTPVHCDLVTADIPYVVLCSLNSVSMGEITTAGISAMKNGYVIGERTWGGTGALVRDASYLPRTYGGTFGNEANGPIYCYTSVYNPKTFTRDGYKSVEGYGLIPDKEIYFKPTGEDNLITDVRTMLKSQIRETFSYISNR